MGLARKRNREEIALLVELLNRNERVHIVRALGLDP
jgi:hypothetical protein